MKKLFYSLVAILVAWSASLNAQGLRSLQSAAPQSSLRAGALNGFGYADRHSDKAQGIGNGNTASTLLALIELPQMEGNVLKGLSFKTFGKDVKGQGAVVVIDATSKKVLYVQSADIVEGDNTVAFTTPFTLEAGKSYYVGYQIHANAGSAAYVLAFDGKQSLRPANYLAMLKADVAKDQTLANIGNLVGENLDFGSLMIFADIEDKKGFLNDYALIVASDARAKEKANTKKNVAITVRNIGLNAIEKADISYTFPNANAVVSEKNTTIQPGGTLSFSVEVTYPENGVGNLTFALPKINGKDHTSKDTPLVVPYTILSENGPFLKETLLFEHFTTESCGQCPAGKVVFEQYMKTLKEKGYALSYVQHHAGFYTDFLTLKESENLLPYFFGEGSFAPAFCVDRLMFGEEGTLAGSRGISETALLAKVGESLQFGKFTAVEQKVENDRLVVTAKGTLVKGVDPNSLYITAIVTEDNIDAQRQAGATGKYVHQAVARVFLSSEFGDKATVNGTEFTITFPAKEIKADWKPEDLKIILIAGRDLKSTKTAAEREIFFSTNVGYGKELATTTISTEDMPRVFINNGYVSIQGWVNSFEVYDMSGRFITNSTTYQLPNGVYVVRVNNDFGNFTSKVVVR